MEKNELMRMEDLVDNPSNRVPICLCLDTSDSMLRVVGGETRATGRTEFRDGKTWNVVEGGITALQELQDGVNQFFAAIAADDTAKYSAEICIVTFDSKANLLADYATVDLEPNPPKLTTRGDTHMGEGVMLALELLEERKEEYKRAGVDYFQPWLVLMTDGQPNGDPALLQEAIERTSSLVNDRKLTIFPIGIGPEADLQTLNKFSPTRPALRLKGMNFGEFFEWLSSSVSAVSSSMPGEKIQLDLDRVRSWGEI